MSLLKKRLFSLVLLAGIIVLAGCQTSGGISTRKESVAYSSDGEAYITQEKESGMYGWLQGVDDWFRKYFW